MPHPHEQKLHEVVNSLTSESFRSFVAARTADTSRSPSSARPAPPATVSFKSSLRVTLVASSGRSALITVSFSLFESRIERRGQTSADGPPELAIHITGGRVTSPRRPPA